MTVVTPRGFRAAGVAAGLKSAGGLDCALVVNDGPQWEAAGVFTRNRVTAAPVLWTRAACADGRLRAIVLNSGGANACTGPAGFADTHRTAEHVADALGVGAIDVGVCSTGIIGRPLDLPRLLRGIDAACAALGSDESAGRSAAEAIMTTDTVAKTVSRVDPQGWAIGGMAKGAGMLAPGLATMLVVLTTDAKLPASVLHEVLTDVVSRTFDRLDSDGCQSTNDTVLLCANGAAGVAPGVAEIRQALTEVCTDLVHQMLDDAEGATKQVTVEVTEAATVADALLVARAVARSNLVKCAVHGEDPNWGRILAAVGTTAAAFESDRLAVAINGVDCARAGAAISPIPVVDMSGRQVRLSVRLGAGPEAAEIWTNDLSAGYVHENSAYPT
ncbi:MAG: bifunctional glutamate N-acetyltransferase/amino-acid acetyltransferase ArgJ [Actinomycetales bacterium]|nr:bifunctional glutamate N-acetyltransferase/amino-acid acetyltransferase ArgJ [Actinomycetales bacterium]